MGRVRQLVLGMTLSSAPLAAQESDRGFDPSSRPFHAGLAATIVPIVSGIVLMVAGKGDGEQEPAATGVYLATGGLLLGPAVGNWVGGLYGRGFARLGLRTVAFMGGLAAETAPGWDSGQSTTGGALFLGGLGIASGLAVWDLATLKGAVRRKRGESVTVAPLVRPDLKTVGVTVHLTF